MDLDVTTHDETLNYILVRKKWRKNIRNCEAMKLNSQDPRIIDAREAITSAHKELVKKKCQSRNRT